MIQMRAQDEAGVFDGDGAKALEIDRHGMVVSVESLDGEGAGDSRSLHVSLADLLAREELATALAEVRTVLETRASRFVTWTVSEGDSFRPYAGWLHPNGGDYVIGVLRWFGV